MANENITPNRDLGVYNGDILNESIRALRPGIVTLYQTIETLLVAANDVNTIQTIFYEFKGVTHDDFKLTAVLHNLSIVENFATTLPYAPPAAVNKTVVKFVIAGPYGSHIDADLLWVEQLDELKQVIDYYTDGVTAYSTVARMALFIEEAKTHLAGLGALPGAPDSVILLKP
jgi:hypothetical protein